MRERRSQRRAPNPWRLPIAVEEIPESGRQLALVADAQVRADLARMAGVRDLARLEADFEVTRQGAGGLRVTGRVSATVGQDCVVTLEPLANVVEEKLDLLFVRQSAGEHTVDKTGGGERPLARDESEALIDGCVDLGALAAEFFILGIDRYPRKPGAVFEAPRENQAGESPFSALAGWSKGRDGN